MRTQNSTTVVTVKDKDLTVTKRIKIVKWITLRFIIPGQATKTVVLRAKPGRYYTDTDIDRMLADAAEKCEKAFPNVEFRLVCLPNHQFNFVAVPEQEEDN